MHYRLGFLLILRKSISTISNPRILSSSDGVPSLLRFSLINGNAGTIRRGNSDFDLRRFCSYAAEQFSDDEYDCEFENHKCVFNDKSFDLYMRKAIVRLNIGWFVIAIEDIKNVELLVDFNVAMLQFISYEQASSTVANVDEWKWKLSLLLRNEEDREIVSRDKRDRRDYEQISNLAQMMGLYSALYGKVVVASKTPLPNYRPDLDEKRPQREVVIPLSLQRRVEGLLQEHFDRQQLSSGKICDTLPNDKDTAQYEDSNPNENLDSVLDGSVMEKVLQRRSWRMRNMQRAWQESPEGKKMIDFRMSLPAYKEKERLLSAIARNQVIVISGETGCGKTTQLPQYVLESQIESGRGAFCNIICTQPRRISAMAVAERVSTERGEPLGESVGYKVRLEGMKGKNTHLLFCTSGILLRRLLSDRNLNGVTHVFVDEIHERGMNEDFLLIVLKDLLPRRRDLRLILMSATLDAELFSNYFGGAPKIHIPGFTYPVRALFLEDVLEITGHKLTSFNQIDDYGQEKFWKTQKQLLPRKRKNQITALVEVSRMLLTSRALKV
ncbi:hypothetical protein Syun_002317 [Stephania yunnanensis]|uniref:RNA helicase n=1 Tax=Stephania yunnanensis TaxID=152371 RepID=A0AAP0LHC1_9MAGN